MSLRCCNLIRCCKTLNMHVQAAFTLIEMLVVLAILAMLLTIVTPKFMHVLQHGKETTLKQDLFEMREAIDKFYSDKNRYPESLQELVEQRYLKAIPADPLTESNASWVITPPTDLNESGMVFDIHSGSSAVAEDGSLYAEW